MNRGCMQPLAVTDRFAAVRIACRPREPQIPHHPRRGGRGPGYAWTNRKSPRVVSHGGMYALGRVFGPDAVSRDWGRPASPGRASVRHDCAETLRFAIAPLRLWRTIPRRQEISRRPAYFRGVEGQPLFADARHRSRYADGTQDLAIGGKNGGTNAPRPTTASSSSSEKPCARVRTRSFLSLATLVNVRAVSAVNSMDAKISSFLRSSSMLARIALPREVQ